MPSIKRKFGDLGEKEAENFLLNKGYRILDRNYRIKNIGEIDLVGEKNGKLFFFEVKTRDVKHETNFPIQLSINEKKRRNLRRICELYLIEKNLEDKEWQADGIFIKVDNSENYKIEHLENILWEKYY
ncbi:MAG: YraN family protein [Candidatus Sungbacteria bacterium]|nr:YraN family protein [Candidatus Sungbacteria bacterium]